MVESCEGLCEPKHTPTLAPDAEKGSGYTAAGGRIAIVACFIGAKDISLFGEWFVCSRTWCVFLGDGVSSGGTWAYLSRPNLDAIAWFCFEARKLHATWVSWETNIRGYDLFCTSSIP